jgi:hypothetical protein
MTRPQFRPIDPRIGVHPAIQFALVAITLLAVPSTGLAQSVSPLAGTWTLVAADEIQPDGTTIRAYGPEPKGTLMVDAEGRYSLQIFRTGRPRFASGDKRKGTAEEYQAAVLGMSSHIGRCAIDSVANTLVFRIEVAAYPNWDGTEQRRQFTLSGDTLSYQVPKQATGNGTIPISIWRRVR